MLVHLLSPVPLHSDVRDSVLAVFDLRGGGGGGAGQLPALARGVGFWRSGAAQGNIRVGGVAKLEALAPYAVFVLVVVVGGVLPRL